MNRIVRTVREYSIKELKEDSIGQPHWLDEREDGKFELKGIFVTGVFESVQEADEAVSRRIVAMSNRRGRWAAK